MIASSISCPVCSEPHDSQARIVGFAVIACPKKTPSGDAAMFPKYDPPVIVLGAGLYVDSAPAKPKSVADLKSEIAELERRHAVKVSDEVSTADLVAKLEALKAAQV